MKSFLAMSFATLVLASPAWAEDKPAEVPDMSKMGPWSRKPTDEKRIKKEIDAFLEQVDEVFKKRDFEASLGMIDFPLYWATDNSKGMGHTELLDRVKWTAMQKPFYENMPKDTEMTHKFTVVVLSDAMATGTDDYVLSTGKDKFAGRGAFLLVKRDGQWKWKVMSEAGWGE